ncbi:MAG TPA: AI-2E family transporter [Candidatus Paceibacterota bacterium]|nr:AI-2E family transporter [Candidatus Paceibacterota bacterium]HRY76882.1 AI-2E family transporter [Candidatus Paceibacterota bacterium]
MSDFSKKEISWGSFWRLALIVIFLLSAFYLRSVLVVLLFAVIISSALEPLVNWFERRGWGRIWSTLLLYLLSISLLATFLFFVVPIVYQEFLGVIALIPGYSEKISNSFVGSQFSQSINDIIINYGGSLLKSGAVVISTLVNIAGGIASAVSVLLISFYLLMRRDGISDFLRNVLPQGIENEVVRVWQRSRYRIGRWFRTQLILSLFVGFLVFLSLWIMGVRYSLILGIVAAIFEIVPIAGPIFAGAVSAVVALTQSLPLAIWVIIVFLLIQQLESNIFVPLIMKKSVGLNPIMIILGILAGAKLGGIVGVVLAAPVLVFLEEIITELNRRKTHYLPIKED